jgi:hypothetical protein
MIDAKHCSGCEDDFYNGKNPYGVQECWSRKDAQIVPRLLIHIDQTPPYNNVKAQQVPHCYKRKRFVTVKPDQIDSRGYWRT